MPLSISMPNGGLHGESWGSEEKRPTRAALAETERIREAMQGAWDEPAPMRKRHSSDDGFGALPELTDRERRTLVQAGLLVAVPSLAEGPLHARSEAERAGQRHAAFLSELKCRRVKAGFTTDYIHAGYEGTTSSS